MNTKIKIFTIFAIVAATLAAQIYSPKNDIDQIKDLLKISDTKSSGHNGELM